MAKLPDVDQRVRVFAEQMVQALKEGTTGSGGKAQERRLLRTITRECKTRATTLFLTKLQMALKDVGVETSPALTESSLRPSDWVYFGTEPFPEDALLFGSEKQLQRFVESCLGTGVFRNLKLHKNGREYRLRDGRKVDLLCDEITRSGGGAIVAIEIKRDRQTGTVEQLAGYLEELKAEFPGRDVRGIIISGHSDPVGVSVLNQLHGYRIDWYCYDVSFPRLAGSPVKT